MPGWSRGYDGQRLRGCLAKLARTRPRRRPRRCRSSFAHASLLQTSMSDFDASLRSLAFRRWRRERALDLASRAPQRYVKGASAEPSLGLGSRNRFGRSEGDSGVVGLCPVADDEELACGYGALFNQPLGGHRRSPPRRRRYPAQIPNEVVGSPRRCPPIAGRRREKSPAIAANPRVAPEGRIRPVTPEVAGSSPVAPAKVPANRHLLVSVHPGCRDPVRGGELGRCGAGRGGGDPGW